MKVLSAFCCVSVPRFPRFLLRGLWSLWMVLFLSGITGACSPQTAQAEVAFLDAAESVSTLQNRLAEMPPKAFGSGFHPQQENGQTVWFCDAGENSQTAYGVAFTFDLNQKRPVPIFAAAESRSEGVARGGLPNYSVYLDLVYMDGSFQWGVSVPFTGGETWEKKTLTFAPAKPIKHVAMYLIFRETPGKAWFRAPVFAELCSENGTAHLFDGTMVQPISTSETSNARFPVEQAECPTPVLTTGRLCLHDLTAERSNWLQLEPNAEGNYEAAGICIERTSEPSPCSAAMVDVLKVRASTKCDRCVTLVYALRNADVTEKLAQTASHAIPVFTALDEDSEASPEGQQEVSHAQSTAAGMKRLSDIPVLAVPGQSGRLYGLGLDPEFPAVHRLFFNAVTQEWCIAYDLAFTAEQTEWELRCARFCLEPAVTECHGSRRMWEAYMQAFPEAFALRLPIDPQTGRPVHGNWMPFAKVSKVPGYEDFAFRFKEGENEAGWDDAHGILTFRYTEPMTWWWNFTPEETESNRNVPYLQLAVDKLEQEAQAGNASALLWKNSVMYDGRQKPFGVEQRTPWCAHGVVWSMNSVPGVVSPSDFERKWNAEVLNQFYPENSSWTPEKPQGLDGEYVDSSEGYVTTELDFRREHFASVTTPLTFDLDSKQPVLFRGLVAFEYVRGLARDVHARNRWMMANATPGRLSWLAGQLDIMGTETNWNYLNRWQPMTLDELRFRRMLCGGKPFCFLMNSDFSKLTHEHVEKYMKRSLAFGMFPGFFSADASTGHYFEQPQLYERDRELFRKYLPVCRLLSESGWQPDPHASVSDKRIGLERFGSVPSYLTLFNPTDEPLTFRLCLNSGSVKQVILGDAELPENPVGELTLTLAPEDVLVLELGK